MAIATSSGESRARLAHYLEKLAATPDADGSLLDNLVLLYGSGMGDSTGALDMLSGV